MKEKVVLNNLYSDAWEKLKKDKVVMISLAVLIVIILLAIFAPVIAPYPPEQQNMKNMLSTFSKEHLLGTDEFGRDILTRILYGARASLLVAVLGEVISVIIGVTLGVVAGYFGGVVDAIISRIIEIFSSFPQILFAIAIMFALGPGIENVFITIGITGWTGIARIIRADVMKLKHNQYIEMCKISGGSTLRILVRHVIPNCLSTITVVATMNIPGNIMYEASLSFLGLGVQPPTASWGVMINTSRNFLRTNPTYSIYPGIAIIITVLAFNILGDGLRDALDPKLN
ncbi:peptide/nickel transport system permease protein [Clostridium collagenovorans DSM 3089]|uniref:Peptide/nickel transport system permease protein n=1 Tax=Clostridium collagenovorans DSM 3089 TaxID=1121306 RepID=A0A1M5Y526_9CLOT|nr:nickel/cobalt ABC transporter permease [Clostridium collagenovorans]SHI06573.1 peptide/nickel transport system permease protein [Clostridium collagenovorans DSM 3089]